MIYVQIYFEIHLQDDVHLYSNVQIRVLSQMMVHVYHEDDCFHDEEQGLDISVELDLYQTEYDDVSVSITTARGYTRIKLHAILHHNKTTSTTGLCIDSLNLLISHYCSSI